MKSKGALAVASLAIVVLLVSAHQQDLNGNSPPQSSQPGKVQLPKSQVPDLGRPARVTDKQPLLDFEEYFVGTWSFEWELPDGTLGPGGTIKGTIVYTHIDGPFYEADTNATGPDGAFRVKEMIAYRKESKTAARWITDGRGFAFQQLASVGGDLGGYFNLYYEGAPFTYKGKTIRLKNFMRLVSPIRYRDMITISTDGGPFANYGNPWYEKDVSGVTSKP